MTISVVIGGASGIGRAVAENLHDRGDAIIIVDRDTAGKAVAEKLGGGAHFVEADMSTSTGPQESIAGCLSLTKGELDVLYFGPAILESRRLADWTVEDWDRSLSVNLRAAFFACQAAEGALRKSKLGRIVLMSSTGAFRGHAGMHAYHASKAGMLGLVRSLADEFAPSVTVNAVCPGWIDTPFNDSFWSFQDNPDQARDQLEASIPARRQGQPSDVVGIINFLTTPEASYITGQSVTVDGGYTAV
jgi:3-oxoacyl-[acyl-carrier protein] reductase